MSTYTPLTICSCHTTQHLYHTPNTRTTPSAASMPRKRTAEPGIVFPYSSRMRLRTKKEDNHGLQNENFYSEEFTQGISAYDKINRGKIEQVPNYVTNIYQRLYYAEVRTADPVGLACVGLLLLINLCSTF